MELNFPNIQPPRKGRRIIQTSRMGRRIVQTPRMGPTLLAMSGSRLPPVATNVGPPGVGAEVRGWIVQGAHVSEIRATFSAARLGDPCLVAARLGDPCHEKKGSPGYVGTSLLWA